MRLGRFFVRHCLHLLGIQEHSSGHIKTIVSTIGGFAGIIAVILFSHDFLGSDESSMIIASMGASSVLSVAVPHGPLSQPWAMLGGHTLSAIIGVSCVLVISDKYTAAAVAMGLSIGSMHYMRCIHPPGGAHRISSGYRRQHNRVHGIPVCRNAGINQCMHYINFRYFYRSGSTDSGWPAETQTPTIRLEQAWNHFFTRTHAGQFWQRS